MDLIISLLVLALVVVIAMYIVDQLSLPANIGWIVKLIIGVIVLIILLNMLSGVGGFNLRLR